MALNLNRNGSHIERKKMYVDFRINSTILSLPQFAKQLAYRLDHALGGESAEGKRYFLAQLPQKYL
jgi:hypothetical protein